MLQEHFVASISTPNTTTNTHVAKDAAVFVYEAQPHTAQRALFKKSATPQNCLAVSASHIFAAQAEKAVVHVYSRDKGNQEAVVPFPERVRCIALACEDTVLILGTDTGRIFLWEVCTGRQITTSQAHLQPVTTLGVDPTSNFLLSGSEDSYVHVWSLPSLLSFSSTYTSGQPSQHVPLHTLSMHRGGVITLVLGHSSSFCNIAISASRDSTCIVWDYHSGNALRTILLPSIPQCLTIDPADRAFYTGYEDGSIQMLDFYGASFAPVEGQSIQSALHDEAQAYKPVQPPAATRWKPPPIDVGSTQSMSISYDGTTLLTGHSSGRILQWDVGTGRYSSDLTSIPLPGPVTNIVYQPVSGLLSSTPPTLKHHAISKPRFGAFDAGTDGLVPGAYNITTQSLTTLPLPSFSASEPLFAAPAGHLDFESALTHPVFPSSLLKAGLHELSSLTAGVGVGVGVGPSITSNNTHPRRSGPLPSFPSEESEDFMALDPRSSSPTPTLLLEQQNAQLREELDALRRVQRASFEQMERLRAEKKTLVKETRREAKARSEREARSVERSDRAWQRLGKTGEYAESSGGEEEEEEEEEEVDDDDNDDEGEEGSTDSVKG